MVEVAEQDKSPKKKPEKEPAAASVRPPSEPAGEVVKQFCSSCKHLKRREDFSGRATCDECRPKKRKRCATAVTNKKAELDALKMENQQLSQLAARLQAENDQLQQLIFQHAQRIAKGQQEIQLLQLMLQNGHRRLSGPDSNGMPPNGMPSNVMPPNGMPSNGMPPNGMPPNGMPSNGMNAMGLGSPWQKEWHGGRHLLQAGLMEQGNRPMNAQHQVMAQRALLAQQQSMAEQHAAQHQQISARQQQNSAQHHNLRQMVDAVVNTAKLSDKNDQNAKNDTNAKSENTASEVVAEREEDTHKHEEAN